jgi:sugar (glycoside-pentoside-hexuronide) transporter
MEKGNSIQLDIEKINKAKGGQLLGFSFNNASTNAVYLLISLYFLVFCTEVYGFSALLVGSIMTATRLFDAVTDPLIGILIDRTDTKFGRFRPWILGGAILSAAMIALMFSGINLGSDAANLVYIIVVYSIWVLGYTAQTACTKSAQTIVTAVPKQRSLINALGMVFTLVVYMVAIAGVPVITGMFGGYGSTKAWKLAGIVFGAIQLIFAVFVVLALKKKDVTDNYMKLETAKKPKLKDFVSIFKTNRALQMLIVAASTNKITQTMHSGLTVLFYFYVVGDSAMQTTASFLSMPVMILAMFLMIPIINKYGRKETFTFSSWGGFIFGLLAIYLITLNPSSLLWVVAIVVINLLLTTGAGDINIISMIADSADYEYYKNGRFVPGMIGTSFSFIDKIISSFGTLIIGAILTGIGFVSVTETAASPTMFWAVAAMYFGFPAIGHLCSIIGMKYYPLDKKSHEKMLVELAERDKARNEA